MSVETTTDRSRLGEIFNSASASPYEDSLPAQLPEWQELALRHLHSRSDVLVVAVRDGDRVRGTASFVRKPGIPPQLRLAGAARLYEPNDLHYDSPEALAELCRRLSRLRLPLRLDRIPAESPTLEAVRTAFRNRGLVAVRTDEPSPALTLDGRDPLERLSSRRRSDLRRARRQADKLGGFSFEPLVPTPDTVDDIMERAVAVEAASWKGESGTALARDERLHAFFGELARRLAARGRLRVFFGRVGDQDAAMQIAVDLHSAIWLLKIGYDAELSKCSPGQLLMEESIRHAEAAGARSFEFLGVVEPWTQMWTEEVRNYVSVRAFPFSLRGVTALTRTVAVSLSDRARKARKRKNSAP